jgi:hypothetical protein
MIRRKVRDYDEWMGPFDDDTVNHIYGVPLSVGGPIDDMDYI